jgi:ATP-dependent DNA helicase RecQ
LISEPTGWLDAADQQRSQAFLEKERSQRQTAHQIARQLSTHGNYETVINQFRQDGALALALLHSGGQLHWQNPFNYVLQKKGANVPAEQNDAARQMHHFLHTKECRWRYLLAAFGFPQKAEWRCGHCDRC